MDKRAQLDDVVADLRDGMTIGFGGWGSRRKPMAAVRAIVRRGVRDLRVISYGGPEVGILCATGLVRSLVFGFVTLDSIALDPHFRAARQSGTVAATEFDEGMLYLGLLAAAQRVPFLPTRAGLGSDVLGTDSEVRTVTSPYPDDAGVHEELVAVPALRLDAAFVHVDAADTNGNGQVLGPDPFFDDVFLSAAAMRVVTAERIVAPGELVANGPLGSVCINRLQTDAVVATPGGAHFTSCAPTYERDEAFQRLYVASAASDEAWAEFADRFVHVDEGTYAANVAQAGGARLPGRSPGTIGSGR